MRSTQTIEERQRSSLYLPQNALILLMSGPYDVGTTSGLSTKYEKILGAFLQFSTRYPFATFPIYNSLAD